MTHGMPVEFNSVEELQKGIEKMIQGQVYDFVPGVEEAMDTPNALLHFCLDGSVGIAKFAGYHMLSEEECAVFDLNSSKVERV